MRAFDHFAESLRHFAADDLVSAAESARRARDASPETTLYQAAARFLEQVHEQGGATRYGEPDAFSAFVGAGSNLPLYDNARRLLLERLRARAPRSLLDVGTGEGSLIVPVVLQLDPRPALTFCEPALPLLERALHLTHERGLEPAAYPLPIQDLLDEVDEQWEATVATWTLQYLPPHERATVLGELARRTRWLFVAEFDDASGQFDDPLDPRRIRHIHDRYLQGLAEYPGEEGRRVRQGFLLPVLYGYFARGGQRSTYEQPIARWEAELEQAGFDVAERLQIFPYWWADAYLIVAESRAA